MRAFVIGGAVLAVICVGAAQIANTRLDQTRTRAAEVSKEAPKSADDRRVSQGEAGSRGADIGRGQRSSRCCARIGLLIHARATRAIILPARVPSRR